MRLVYKHIVGHILYNWPSHLSWGSWNDFKTIYTTCFRFLLSLSIGNRDISDVLYDSYLIKVESRKPVPCPLGFVWYRLIFRIFGNIKILSDLITYHTKESVDRGIWILDQWTFCENVDSLLKMWIFTFSSLYKIYILYNLSILLNLPTL